MEINGGIKTIEDIRHHLGLQQGGKENENEKEGDQRWRAQMDGVMLGRIARDNPFPLFSRIDSEV